MTYKHGKINTEIKVMTQKYIKCVISKTKNFTSLSNIFN